MQRVMGALLGGLPGDWEQQEVGRQISTLTMRMGGLGLRSASRMAPAAYWASWADALSMIQGRLPEIAETVTEQLYAAEAGGCLGELQSAATVLDRSGFVGRPHWDNLRAGVRPPPENGAELGEWQHGWQYCASSSLESHFRETVVLPQSSAAHQAHLRSHSGPGGQCSAVRCSPPAPSSSCNHPSFGL